MPLCPRCDPILRNCQRSPEVFDAIASFLSIARQAEIAVAAFVPKPEAATGIAIEKLDRHLDIQITRSEPIYFFGPPGSGHPRCPENGGAAKKHPTTDFDHGRTPRP
jgi:hypothetical protein